MYAESDSDDSLISCRCSDTPLNFKPMPMLLDTSSQGLIWQNCEMMRQWRATLKRATRWVQEVWSIQGNGQKTWETHLTVLRFWRKLGGREAVSCGAKWGIYIVQQKICGVGRGFQNFMLEYTPATKNQIILYPLFAKGPLQIFTLCGTGDAPNTCPSDILRPPQGHGKRGVGCWRLSGAWKLPTMCVSWGMNIWKNSKGRVREFGMMGRNGRIYMDLPTRRYTNAAWKIGDSSVYDFKQSIKFEARWVITVQDACGHSLNNQLNESTQHSGSHLERLIEFLSLYIFAKTPQGFFLLNSCSCYFLPTEIPWA